MNVTPPHITSLAPNEIFVYGSNTAGRHGAGAAKTATNWREALCECIWGRYARYTAIICNQDYCDYLDTQRV